MVGIGRRALFNKFDVESFIEFNVVAYYTDHFGINHVIDHDGLYNLLINFYMINYHRLTSMHLFYYIFFLFFKHITQKTNTIIKSIIINNKTILSLLLSLSALL